MSEKITFKELVELIAKQSEQSQSSANSFISELVEIIEAGLKTDGQVSISGFGKFELRWMNERSGTNPQTGEQITIPGQNKVVFKPYKALREGVNAPYADLESKIIDKENNLDRKKSKEIFTTPVKKSGSQESLDDLLIERDNPYSGNKDRVIDKQEPEPVANVASAKRPNPAIVKEVRDKGTFNWSFAAAGIIALLAFLLLFYMVQRDPESADPQITDSIESPVTAESETDREMETGTPPPPPAEPPVDEIDDSQSDIETENYEILPGQSLWTIAEAELGNPYLWPFIYYLNSDIIDNPNAIPLATNLQIPIISNPDNLSELERDQVARGYLALYHWNRDNNPDQARYFLWAVGVFSTDLLENLPSDVDAEDLAFALSR
ncbi:MAG: HU family DNA-binding protein [Balneolaceae bacterium]